MDFRLLVDLEAISVLDTMPKRIRTRLLAHFSKLRQFPEGHSDYHERDAIGRRVEITRLRRLRHPLLDRFR